MKLYAMQQKVNPPITNAYSAKGENLETLRQFHAGENIVIGMGGQHFTRYAFAFQVVFPIVVLFFLIWLFKHLSEKEGILKILREKEVLSNHQKKDLPASNRPTTAEPAPLAMYTNPAAVSDPPVNNPATVSDPHVNNPATASDPHVNNPATASDPHVNNPATMSDPHVNNPATVSDPHVNNPATVSDPHVNNPATVSDPPVNNSATVSDPAVASNPSADNPTAKASTITSSDQQTKKYPPYQGNGCVNQKYAYSYVDNLLCHFCCIRFGHGCDCSV